MAGIGNAVRARASIFVRFTRSSIIPSLMATLILLAVGHFYQAQNSANFREALRSDVQSTLRLAEAQIQANIDSNTVALSGLANDIALDGDISSARFAALATKIMERNPGIRRISLAPDGVISRIMPSMQHARMVGMRLDRFYSQRTASQRAKAHGRAAIGSLLVLPDGSTGFDVYTPVFSSPHGRPVFWGFVEAVIDESAVYLGADLQAKAGGGAVATGRNTTITLGIRDVSNRADIGDAFFGKNATFHADAVLQDVPLPGGTWQLAGAPLGGFDQRPGNQQEIALAIMACAMIVIVPIILTFGLMGERRRAISALDRRNREFLAMSRRLNLALECSSFGVWEIDLETRLRTWDDRMYSLHGLAPRNGAPGQISWRRTSIPTTCHTRKRC